MSNDHAATLRASGQDVADAITEIEKFFDQADELDLADDTYSVNTLPPRKALKELLAALPRRVEGASSRARKLIEATEAVVTLSDQSPANRGKTLVAVRIDPAKVDFIGYCGALNEVLDAALRAPAPGIPVIDLAWEAVNALGGTTDQNNSYDQGSVDAITKALDVIEKLGGKDPLPQRAAIAKAEGRS